MRASFLCLVVGVVFGLAGCPEQVAVVGDGTRCLLDSDCPVGDLCIEGTCTENPDPDRCTNNGDCDVGLVCRDNGCEQAPAAGDCQSDADCDRADRCTASDVDAVDGDVGGDCLPSDACAHAQPDASGQPVACDDGCFGNCVARPTCDGEDDCAPTEQCDPTDFVCLPIGDCDSDAACPLTAACVDGACTDNGSCVVDTDCPVTESCVDGTCTRNDSCANDDDCPDDQRCSDGLCERRDPCAVDGDCAFDERCVDGTCNVIGDCTTVDDCPVDPNIACLDGTCSRAPCGRDADCDDSLFCNGVETCDPREGCAGGTAPTTANLPACASETCDELTKSLVVVGRDELCGDASPCTDDLCDVGVGCLHPANSFAPDPGPAGDCERTVCEGGALVDVDADDEVPADTGTAGDCLRAVCDNGGRLLVPDNTETPTDQGQSTDCKAAVCESGARVLVNEDAETPLQGPGNDCTRQVCQRGNVVAEANDSEVPTQGPLNDCDREVCRSGRIVLDAADDEVPPQGPANDCKREVCSGGNAVQVANDSESPADVGCKDGSCVNGSPTTVANNGNCTDTEVCTVGSCNVDGTCSQTPDDGLCDCTGTAVGLCRPADPRAPNSGALAGCVCLTPATLTCGLDPGELSAQRVLERFELNATASGAQAGSTFTWDLIGVPAGVDPAAQLITNPTSATLAFFQATAPSVVGVRDYRLRVTLQEPDLPAQTCDVSVEATKIPDTLEVSLFMNAGLDVDLHLISGVGATFFDFPFEDNHNPASGDNENRDCYWKNCPVCAVSIPGQPACVATNPRIVDFDMPKSPGETDEGALADKQDPQLDIDNRRGCFTGTNGDLQCIPEKITVELPDAGTYRVFPYLFGNALATTAGLASTPSSTTVTIEIKCRGVTRTITRTLSSIAAGGGVAASNNPVRYGEPLFIDVPASGACTLP